MVGRAQPVGRWAGGRPPPPPSGYVLATLRVCVSVACVCEVVGVGGGWVGGGGGVWVPWCVWEVLL
jgi:hypothetical protein